MELLKQLVTVKARADELDKQAKAARAEYRQLQEKALDYFADNGLQKLGLDGYTIYTENRTWVKVDLEKPGTTEALNRHGLGWLIRPQVSTMALSAWYKEQADTGADLPQDLLEHFTIDDEPEIRVRKSSNSK